MKSRASVSEGETFTLDAMTGWAILSKDKEKK
jgi:hypothetical protein